ncbi:cytochrome c [Dyella solisilvae]|uniref:Cytochrome c n=1 Tax=Dyella solisilvae TaxID=1920168 RepID=A0A370K7Z6_9GAMM|nr:cytochrome c [Dyella solisilvae]RDI98778.1 cytochrome c [Dyella solisilvae]
MASLASGVAASTNAPIPDTLEQRLVACAACHGPHGAGDPGHPDIPRLAGQPAAYLALQLEYFRSGERKNAEMEFLTRQLSPAYIKEIAAYFSSQQAPYVSTPAPALTDALMSRGEELVRRGDASRGIPACTDCHGQRLTGRDNLIPGLTELSYDYMNAQFALWKGQSRAAEKPYCMAVVAIRMSESDQRAAVAWLASHGGAVAAETAHAAEPPLPGWCVLNRGANGP